MILNQLPDCFNTSDKNVFIVCGPETIQNIKHELEEGQEFEGNNYGIFQNPENQNESGVTFFYNGITFCFIESKPENAEMVKELILKCNGS
jgi:hypothetical protein